MVLVQDLVLNAPHHSVVGKTRTLVPALKPEMEHKDFVAFSSEREQGHFSLALADGLREQIAHGTLLFGLPEQKNSRKGVMSTGILLQNHFAQLHI